MSKKNCFFYMSDEEILDAVKILNSIENFEFIDDDSRSVMAYCPRCKYVHTFDTDTNDLCKIKFLKSNYL